MKAAEHGYPIAQTSIGVLYEEGRGLGQDFTQAAEWYKKAAIQNGLTLAQDRADALENGQPWPIPANCPTP